jgi:hypothetical protein
MTSGRWAESPLRRKKPERKFYEVCSMSNPGNDLDAECELQYSKDQRLFNYSYRGTSWCSGNSVIG